MARSPANDLSLQEDLRGLDAISSERASATLRVVSGEGGSAVTVNVPSSALPLVVEVLQRVAQGQRPVLVEQDRELTTQEAAEILHVSRPYVVQLLEQGRIPFRKVGRYRRIALSDLLSYKAEDDARRGEAMQELADIAQEWDMGY